MFTVRPCLHMIIVWDSNTSTSTCLDEVLVGSYDPLSAWVSASNFWSSSPNAGNSSNAWNVNFNNGNDNWNNRNNTNAVRLVRVGE